MLSLFLREAAAPQLTAYSSLPITSAPHYLSTPPHYLPPTLPCSLLTPHYQKAVAPAAGLFELAADGDGAAALPRADAPPEALRQCGRVMLKAILDDHPLGTGIAPFVLEYLIDAHERRVL